MKREFNLARAQSTAIKQSGFTLIEILVALSIFSILAAITSGALYQALTTRERTTVIANELASLQMAITRIQQDTIQSIGGAIPGLEHTLQSPFTGDGLAVTFTRAGVINPGAIEKRSTLQRVQYRCENNQLIRLSWLFSTKPDLAQKNILLTEINNCQFAYLNQQLQLLPSWESQEGDNARPKAIQITFTRHRWGDMNMLFPLGSST